MPLPGRIFSGDRDGSNRANYHSAESRPSQSLRASPGPRSRQITVAGQSRQSPPPLHSRLRGHDLPRLGPDDAGQPRAGGTPELAVAQRGLRRTRRDGPSWATIPLARQS